MPDLLRALGLRPKSTGAEADLADAAIAVTLPLSWRYATHGVGVGEWARGTVVELAPSSAGIAIARQIPAGIELELKMHLGSERPLHGFAQIVSVQGRTAAGRYGYGVRLPASPEREKAIADYINRRQTDRRERGIA